MMKTLTLVCTLLLFQNAFALNNKISERIERYESELSELITNGLERLIGQKDHMVLVDIQVNSKSLERSMLKEFKPDVKGLLKQLPGIHITPEDLERPPIAPEEISKEQLVKHIRSVAVLIRTTRPLEVKSEDVTNLIQGLIKYHLDSRISKKIEISVEEFKNTAKKALEGEAKDDISQKNAPKGLMEQMLDNFISKQLITTLLILLAFGAFIYFAVKLTQKILGSFTAIENSIKEASSLSQDFSQAAMFDNDIQDSVQEDQKDVDIENLNQDIQSIENLANIDYPSYQKAFKLYLDLGQIDEAIVLVNFSAKLANDYPSLLNDTDRQRFKNKLKNRTVTIFESKPLLAKLCKDLLQSIRVASISPDTMYNFILKKNISQSLNQENIDFNELDSEEIGKIIELSTPENIADSICNKKISINQIQQEPLELSTEGAVSLINKFRDSHMEKDQNDEYQNKLIEVAMELPMDMEKSFITSLKLTNDQYPVNLRPEDIEYIFNKVRTFNIDEASALLGCLSDDVRIDLINKLPDIMAKRLSAKGFKVSPLGRKIKKTIWKQLASAKISQNKSSQNKLNEKNAA